MSAKAVKETPRLTEDQLAHMYGLIRGADSVELKLTAPDTDTRSIGKALGADPLGAEIRQVVFFDTPDLTLNNAGVVVRARRVQLKGGDTVIKLRPVVPAELPKELRKNPNFGVELDAMPGGFVCSGSFKGIADDARILGLIREGGSIRKLYSKEQRAFFKAHAPDGLELDDLSVLGPITVFKLKWTPKGYNRRMVAELWNYPDGSRILELSTKCLPGEAFQVITEVRMFLRERGIDTTADQQTKTKTALEYFTKLLKEEQA